MLSVLQRRSYQYQRSSFSKMKICYPEYHDHDPSRPVRPSLMCDQELRFPGRLKHILARTSASHCRRHSGSVNSCPLRINLYPQCTTCNDIDEDKFPAIGKYELPEILRARSRVEWSFPKCDLRFPKEWKWTWIDETTTEIKCVLLKATWYFPKMMTDWWIGCGIKFKHWARSKWQKKHAHIQRRTFFG